VNELERLFGPPARMSEEETLQFLAYHSLYPMISGNGKVYLRPTGKTRLSEAETADILSGLEIKTPDHCRTLRNRISKLRAANRESQPIRSWVKEERPRERLMKLGADALSDSSLIAIILRTGMEGTDAEELGRRLINRFGSIRGIDKATISEICATRGIGPAKAVQIKAALEIGKRFLREKVKKGHRIGKPSDIVDYVAQYYGPYLRDSRKEIFCIILLDIKNKPIHNIEISRGSINASIVNPGEIIREATLRSASAVILVHNHPSGETEPSGEDVRLTRRIIEACGLVDIKVLDHVIIGKNFEDYYSFASAGLIR